MFPLDKKAGISKKWKKKKKKLVLAKKSVSTSRN